jgi:tRNA nucleotidyltransferase (CCA-adding enzyme)
MQNCSIGVILSPMNQRNSQIASTEAIRRNVPPAALAVIEVIKQAGGEAYLVGGCLRDLLLGRLPNDWDIATDITPNKIKTLFPTVHEVGAAFGTLLIRRGESVFEVTTFRTEHGYSDGRHPDEVAYTRSLEEDLQRRDFTINAMAWDPTGDQIRDPFNGAADLEARLIRAVGEPQERFSEDALRLMRAVRFSAQLGFMIEENTWDAIIAETEGLHRISRERIRDELNKIMLSPVPSGGLRQLLDSGLLKIVLPELAECAGVTQNRFHAHDVFEHCLLAADAAPRNNLPVRLAALLHDIAKPDTKEERDGDFTFYAHQVIGARKVDRILRRLRYSNEQRQQITHLVYNHMFFYEPHWTDSAVRRFVRTVGMDSIPDLIALRIADMSGNSRKSGSTAPLEALLDRVDDVIAKDTALSVKDLVIGGRELMELGVPEGPGIGRIMRALLEIVLDEPEANERERLLELAGEMLADGVHLHCDKSSE